MQSDRDYTRRAVTRTCGWGLFGVAVVTMSGYLFRVEGMNAAWIGRDRMSFASAVCFLVVSLWMLYCNYRRMPGC